MPLENEVHWDEMEPTSNRRLGRVITTLNQAAVFLRQHGHIDEAIEVLNALSWGDPTYECGSYAFELGLCYEAKGDVARALDYYEIALRENPGMPGRAEAVARLEGQR